jgi:hypothetical protein
LHVGPVGLGVLRSAPGVGAALVAVRLAQRPITRHAGTWMFGGVALYGVATAASGQSTSFVLSAIALFAIGCGDMVSVIRPPFVGRQLETPDAIRGRVSAVSSDVHRYVQRARRVRIGGHRTLAAEAAVTVGGIACLLVVGTYLQRFPELRRLDRFPEPAEE